MKSNIQDLEKRGYLTKNKYQKKLKEYIIEDEMHNRDPLVRTAYFRWLLDKDLSDDAIDNIMESLRYEKKLYTKIEISNLLEKQDEYAVICLVNNLGKIGNNQFKSIDKYKTSLKKSYPLPRDICARILSRMDYKYFNTIIKTAKEDLLIVRELVDVLGYMCFYNDELITLENFKQIINSIKPCFDDEVVLIKFITLCSAFPYRLTKGVLDSLPVLYSEKFLKELARTREIQNFRKKLE